MEGAVSGLEKGAEEELAEVPGLAEGVVYVRGDRIEGGLEVSDAISVYLHGSCSLAPAARTQIGGGCWARRLVCMAELSHLFMWTAGRSRRCWGP